MRFMKIVAPFLLLLVISATQVRAQEEQTPQLDPVPLTMTFEAESDRHEVQEVYFYQLLPDEVSIGSAAVGDSVYQVLVGYVAPHPGTGQYTVFAVEMGEELGGRQEPQPITFGPVDTCTNSDAPDAGEIKRIACSVVRDGSSLVCTAIYEGMDDPKAQCGSQQCILCNRIRICGSDPICEG
jgi:hypothetical protein